MRPVVPLAVLVSVGAHGMLLAGASITWAPQKLPDQRPPEARLDIAAQPVTASTAAPAEPAGERAAATAAGGQQVDGSPIPQSVARASAPASAIAPSPPLSASPAPAASARGAITRPAAPDSDRVTGASGQGATIAGTAISQTPARARQPVVAPASSLEVAGTSLAASDARGSPSLTAQPEVMPAEVATPDSLVLPRLPPGGDAAPAFSADGDALPSLAADGVAVPPLSRGGDTVQSLSADTDALPALSPPSERGTASLAWVGDQGAIDPLSLAAIQAFMQPADIAASDANSGRLRDGIAGTLSAVPCARLQTSFDPETGSIELRGHLPEDGLRAPVLAALQAQVGTALPITDRLRVLPRPLCQVLGAIANTGLAQSTEQETNPRIVGPDTFVRDYDLTAGQRVVFDMVAPDYPSVIYVDYFDAAGNVLHMQPNDRVPAVRHDPKVALAIGRAADGVPALELIVGPPYGQEIAVAFASSVPLYDGVRPTVEPAAPYLEFLAGAVSRARASTPDFKGEWVYFFVTTGP